MKKISTAVICLFLAFPLFAQDLAIGGRYSNYSSDISGAGFSLDTGREGSIGFLMEYRLENIVLRGQLDHDFESGLGLFDFFDLADYSRDRFEFSVGYAVIPRLDLELAVRFDSVSVDSFLFGDFFGGSSVDHEAIGFGLHAHSDPWVPVGWFVSGRFYIGSVDLGSGISSQDSTGVRLEAGLPIALGESNWRIIPGIEWERIETKDVAVGFGGFELETNRFILGFAYRR